MALKDTLTSVRFYEESDAYYFTVDNRPVSDLKQRDDLLADRIDTIALGRVDVTGAALHTVNFAPEGWTITRTSAGIYNIVHGLNIDALTYSVQATVYGVNPAIITVTGITANDITIQTNLLSGGAVADVRFSIILTAC